MDIEDTIEIILGDHVEVDPSARVGVRARTGSCFVRIGAGSIIRSNTVIYAGVVAGKALQTGHGALIREDNELGDSVSVGSHTIMEPGNRIGHRSRIHSNCFLENVTLGDDVFIGPNVVFTDDPHPPCPDCTKAIGGAHVGNGAAIGGNSTILPGVRIGEGALIGAGSVVTKDVPPGAIVAGNPARLMAKNRNELTCRPHPAP